MGVARTIGILAVASVVAFVIFGCKKDEVKEEKETGRWGEDKTGTGSGSEPALARAPASLAL